MSVPASQVASTASPAAARLPLAAAVFLLGAVFVFIAGFAQPDLLHSAAHDMCHAMSFPCH